VDESLKDGSQMKDQVEKQESGNAFLQWAWLISCHAMSQ
jgi:hypothetical protein